MYTKRYQSQRFYRLDRLHYLIFFIFLNACGLKAQEPVSQSRFQAATPQSLKAAQRFCDITNTGKVWQRPLDKALPFAQSSFVEKPQAWTWINFWATWCAPCLEEMPLIQRFSTSLNVNVELWSIDEDPKDLTPDLKKLPGRILWLANADDFSKVMTPLGLDKNAAIPVHAFIDPKGQLRCVRMGSLREEHFGVIKTMLEAGD